jgi:peptidoglycan/LPS O-acetylase OafA/YrhL
MTSLTTKKIPHLDGWRGVAILLVLGEHFFAPGKAWIGAFGVMLFFVLSGHLMSNLLFLKNVKLTDFFVRRFSRIIPTFWLYILAMITYAATFQEATFSVPFGEALSTLIFMRTYLPSGEDIWRANWAIGNLWSLNVEEHSYIFLAIGAFVCRKFDKRIVIFTFLWSSTFIVLLINIYYRSSPPNSASPWFLRSECAALGLLAAAAMRYSRAKCGWRWIQTVPPLLPIFSFLVGLACLSTYGHKGVDRTVAPICLAFSITYLDQTPSLIRSILSARILQWFGIASFSLYLWQQPFMMAANELRISPLVGFLAAIAVGALSFYSFEDPIRLFINRAHGFRKSDLVDPLCSSIYDR